MSSRAFARRVRTQRLLRDLEGHLPVRVAEARSIVRADPIDRDLGLARHLASDLRRLVDLGVLETVVAPGHRRLRLYRRRVAAETPR